ncbi:MIP18 family protein [Golovinomyces cichoracearum]|uniref:MIP18 family protein n=1 Tax=Golovinomyces cichoracearum TaxID=62708 RepID=A0A420IUM5_9PEZI|nr:MIP18 family protein [Golovinomyces cichoracearum]
MVLDNANPTILNATELASHQERRKNKRVIKGRYSVMKTLTGEDGYIMDPYYMCEQPEAESDSDDSNLEPIDEQEIYDLIAPISDPEHPLSLESLGVVKLQDVHLKQLPDHSNPVALSHVLVELTPTVTHCSLATVIGLGVRVRLEQALPPSYRVEVRIKKDTHSQAEEVSKQLADKERVAAALENENLMGILRKMMKPCFDDSVI